EVEAVYLGARQRVTWAQTQRDAALARARLAQETQAFFDKSFKWGETDLPTRLRIAQEAQEATRQAALAQIDVAAAVSALRQAAGLLPD
ncbi:MAG TPA: transporter, partial [Aquabacterium sp.]|nr:transporter [Aquabacterium sp.]